jgi:hypothetical protein
VDEIGGCLLHISSTGCGQGLRHLHGVLTRCANARQAWGN